MVRRRIEEALHQRDLQLAKRHLIEDALKAHQADLMAILMELSEVIKRPTTKVDVGLDDAKGVPFGIRYPGAVAGTDRYERLDLEAEGKLSWGHLREHIPSDPVLDVIKRWKAGILKDLNARLALWNAIWAEAESVIGVKVQNPMKTPPCLGRGFPWVVYHQVIAPAFGSQAEALDRSSFTVEADGRVRVLYGSELFIARVPGDEDRCIESFMALVELAKDWDETRAVAEAYLQATHLTQKALKVLEETSLTHFLPGRCAVCKRLGV